MIVKTNRGHGGTAACVLNFLLEQFIKCKKNTQSRSPAFCHIRSMFLTPHLTQGKLLNNIRIYRLERRELQSVCGKTIRMTLLLDWLELWL